jgi:hypothetical protein
LCQNKTQLSAKMGQITGNKTKNMPGKAALAWVKLKKARPGFPGTGKTCAMPQNKKAKSKRGQKKNRLHAPRACCRGGGAML